MADFGVQATQLSGPRGAGSQPLQGVSVGPDTYQFPLGAANVALEVMDGFVKDEAKTRKNTVVGSYNRDLSSVSQALEQGLINPAEAAAREKAIGTKYATQYADQPDFIEAFGKSRNTIMGISTLGTTKDAADQADKIRNGYIATAQKLGYYIPPNASNAEMEPILKAAQQVQRTDEDTARLVRQQSELRAQGADQRAMSSEQRAESEYTRKTAENEMKTQANQLINTTASANLEATMSMGQTLRNRIKTGELTREQAETILANNQTTIAAQLQAVAGMNPELAAPWQRIFDDANKASLRAVDPKVAQEDLEAQYKGIVFKGKLLAIADPSVRGAVIGSEMFPNTAVGSLYNAPAVMTTIAMISGAPPGQAGARSPQVVASGNVELEKGVYQVARDALKNLQSNRVGNMANAVEQNKNSINTVLSQTGKLLNDGTIQDTDFKEVSKFMASPEFAYAVKQGMLDPEARQGAKAAWQVKYQTSVVNGVQRKLMQEIPADAPLGSNSLYGSFDTGVVSPAGGDANSARGPKLADSLDIEFNGAGIRFVPNKRANQDNPILLNGVIGGRALNSSAMTSELNTMTTAVNQLIQIGAHLEGTTDYAKYWEDNKFRILPDYFADPRNLAPGQVVNGYKFKGGNTRDQRNWEREVGNK